MTMFERKNNSWVPSTTNPVSMAGVQELLELSAIASESSCTQDRIVETRGQGYSMTSASAASLTTNEVTKGESFLHEIASNLLCSETFGSCLDVWSISSLSASFIL